MAARPKSERDSRRAITTPTQTRVTCTAAWAATFQPTPLIVRAARLAGAATGLSLPVGAAASDKSVGAAFDVESEVLVAPAIFGLRRCAVARRAADPSELAAPRLALGRTQLVRNPA